MCPSFTKASVACRATSKVSPHLLSSLFNLSTLYSHRHLQGELRPQPDESLQQGPLLQIRLHAHIRILRTSQVNVRGTHQEHRKAPGRVQPVVWRFQDLQRVASEAQHRHEEALRNYQTLERSRELESEAELKDLC